MGFVTDLVPLDDLAGTVKPTDRISWHAEYIGGLLGAYALAFGYAHIIPSAFDKGNSSGFPTML